MATVSSASESGRPASMIHVRMGLSLLGNGERARLTLATRASFLEFWNPPQLHAIEPTHRICHAAVPQNPGLKQRGVGVFDSDAQITMISKISHLACGNGSGLTAMQVPSQPF